MTHRWRLARSRSAEPMMAFGAVELAPELVEDVGVGRLNQTIRRHVAPGVREFAYE